jgi:hypothetical protein
MIGYVLQKLKLYRFYGQTFIYYKWHCKILKTKLDVRTPLRMVLIHRNMSGILCLI